MNVYIYLYINIYKYICVYYACRYSVYHLCVYVIYIVYIQLIYVYIYIYILICQWSGRLGFNPRSSHAKSQKMVLDTALLNTQHYKVRI